MDLVESFVWLMDGVVFAYVAAFFLINFVFVFISYRKINYLLRADLIRPARTSENNQFMPTITLLVPAYNEEVTIAESVRSLLRLQYPSFEVVICNDGSKDDTVGVLREAFNFVRAEIGSTGHFPTARVRATYESQYPHLPPGLKRIVLIDKENGGKADALNAAINVSRGDFVTSMDADSLLQPDTLHYAARPIVADPQTVVAVGVNVGLSNGALVKDGRVVDVRLPKSWIARYQIVEYMRSFGQGRVALGQLNSLLVLSGVFALLRRDVVVAIGGFLTKYVNNRVCNEYCGPGAHTVCEDMEIVVRLHRYLLDRKVKGIVSIIPFPLAWTEAPEVYRDLGKQRARWYRGLLETLYLHRGVIMRPRFRQIGLFSLPYQIVFEALAPPLESMGYCLLIATAGMGMVSLEALLAFLALAAAISLSISFLSIFMCVSTERATKTRLQGIALFPYRRLSEIVVLLLAGVLSNFGYRQFLVYWQMRGLWDYLKGKKGWDKFARKGFATK